MRPPNYAHCQNEHGWAFGRGIGFVFPRHWRALFFHFLSRNPYSS
jgi:hypothetical protein